MSRDAIETVAGDRCQKSELAGEAIDEPLAVRLGRDQIAEDADGEEQSGQPGEQRAVGQTLGQQTAARTVVHGEDRAGTPNRRQVQDPAEQMPEDRRLLFGLDHWLLLRLRCLPRLDRSAAVRGYRNCHARGRRMLGGPARIERWSTKPAADPPTAFG